MLRLISTDDSGAVIIELLLIAITTITVLFAGIDLSLLAYRISALEHSLSSSARWGSLGKVTVPGSTREDSIENLVRDTAKRYGINLSSNDIRICPIPSNYPLSCSPNNAGGPEDFIAIEAKISSRIFLGKVPFTLNASVVTRNEPF